MQVNPAIFESFPFLETRRLLLRDIRISDAIRIFEMRADNRVNEFIARPNMQSERQANELVNKTIKAYRDKLAVEWAAVRKGSSDIIGTCGYNRIDFLNLRAEIGGELSSHFWGRHLAQEAVEAIVNFGFYTMNLHSIEAKVSPLNRGAIYLLESIGFKKEAHFREMICFEDMFSDLAVYAMIKGEENFSLSE
jgi:[ribosomal protein S5]-alanine N-acetyltransferase